MRIASRLFPALILSTLFALAARADVVETVDGARLVGQITAIGDETITLTTAYAGELTIQRRQVVGFSTDGPVNVRLDSGTTVRGPLQHMGDGAMVIAAPEGQFSTTADRVALVWPADGPDPAEVAAAERIAALTPNWRFEAGANIVGKSGNNDELKIGATFKAVRETEKEKLKFYAAIQNDEVEGTQTAEEYIAGIDYQYLFGEHLGYYVRGEGERDEFEDIELRATAAGGLLYQFFKQDDHWLEGRAGLSYRHETYFSGGSEEFPGLELAIEHFWRFSAWGELTNSLSYQPAFEDFGDFRVVHDSAVLIPLADARWKLRLGLENEYNSEPTGDLDELDTTWYARLLLNWD